MSIKFDLITIWMSLHEGSSLFINEVFEADCAKFN